MGYRDALDRGAMALFSEKYGDVVRVVEIPASPWNCAAAPTCAPRGRSACSAVVSESGVAAGVRRIEAVTGRRRSSARRRDESTVREAARLLRTREDNLIPRIQGLQEELRDAQRALDRARSLGSADVVGTAHRRGAGRGRASAWWPRRWG
jgi:alanyl-tRNA synthetase